MIVCGKPVPVEWKLYNFRDHPDFDATRLSCYLDQNERPTAQVLPFRPAEGIGQSPARFAARGLMHGGKELERLQHIVHQVVMHHDGLFSASQCFHVLHDERGLSTHFIVDNDGTIYQTLDLLHLGYHASGVNGVSIGIEICNRGDYVQREEPHYAGKRATQSTSIHGASHLMWDFTEPQYQALVALGQALHWLFPRLSCFYPTDRGGLIRTAIQDVREFSGFIGHYHVTQEKWDPGCLDFGRICKEIRGRPSWFLTPPNQSVELSDAPDALEQQAKALRRNNAYDAMGGYFPVGPCGAELIWHGGMHFSQPHNTPLYSPLSGSIVAFCKGNSAAIGSCDFVLSEHHVSITKEQRLRFFLLLFHVEFVSTPPWLVRALAQGLSAPNGQVAFPGIRVRAGEILAYVGEAGPPGSHEEQVHVEIFATEDLSAAFPQGSFQAVYPTDPSGLCTERYILDPLPRAGRSSSGAVLRSLFRRAPEPDELTRLAVRFQSEWVDHQQREAQLRQGPLRMLPNSDSVWRDQIKPTLFWNGEFARRTGLPADGVVWHYHPVYFLSILHKHLQHQGLAVARSGAAGQHRATDGAGGDGGFLDDEDRLMRSGNELRLEDLVKGWPDP